MPSEDFIYWEKLNDLIIRDPKQAWSEISGIADSMKDPGQFAYLAGGPSEDLLVELGDSCQDFFEPCDSPILEKLLPYVWLGRLTAAATRWVEANRTRVD